MTDVSKLCNFAVSESPNLYTIPRISHARLGTGKRQPQEATEKDHLRRIFMHKQDQLTQGRHPIAKILLAATMLALIIGSMGQPVL